MKDLQLKLSYKKRDAESLTLYPVQVIELRDDGSVHLIATVVSTKTLVFWLTGFGAAVKVHGPAKLRAELKAAAAAMAALYS